MTIEPHPTIHLPGIFYYILGNIHPRLRSGSNIIQLLTVVRTTFITKYWMDEILCPFVKDIQKLESVNIMHTNISDLAPK